MAASDITGQTRQLKRPFGLVPFETKQIHKQPFIRNIILEHGNALNSILLTNLMTLKCHI